MKVYRCDRCFVVGDSTDQRGMPLPAGWARIVIEVVPRHADRRGNVEHVRERHVCAACHEDGRELAPLPPLGPATDGGWTPANFPPSRL